MPLIDGRLTLSGPGEVTILGSEVAVAAPLAFATPAFQLHPDQQTTDGYHNLSHHGQAEDKVQQLKDADRQQMALLRKLFQRLAETRENEARLLAHVFTAAPLT